MSVSEEASWRASCHLHLNHTKSRVKGGRQDARVSLHMCVWIYHECAFAIDLRVFLLVHFQRIQYSYALLSGFMMCIFNHFYEKASIKFAFYMPSILPNFSIGEFHKVKYYSVLQLITNMLFSLKEGLLATSQRLLPLFKIENVLDIT